MTARKRRLAEIPHELDRDLIRQVPSEMRSPWKLSRRVQLAVRAYIADAERRRRARRVRRMIKRRARP